MKDVHTELDAIVEASPRFPFYDVARKWENEMKRE